MVETGETGATGATDATSDGMHAGKMCMCHVSMDGLTSFHARELAIGTHLGVSKHTPRKVHEQELLAPNSQRFPRQTNADSSTRPLHRTTQGWEGGKEIKQGSSIY